MNPRGGRFTRALLLLPALILAVMAAPGLASAQAQLQAPGVASLRLVQVAPLLPLIHFYGVVEDGSGQAMAPGGGQFSAMVGSQALTVTARPSPAPIGVVFLIDVSASLRPTQFDLVKDSVLDWINSLGPNDRAAIVTFGSTVQVRAGFTRDRTKLIDIVAGLQARDQNTLLYQGVVDALDLSHRLNPGLPPRRAIVVATDGIDDQTSGAGRQDVTDALALDPVPIYGIGVSARNTPAADAALKDFSALMRSSGGDFQRVTDLHSLVHAFTKMRAITAATTDLIASCAGCKSDGSPAVARLFLNQPNANLASDSVTVRMIAGPATAAPVALVPVASVPAPVPWATDHWHRFTGSLKANPIAWGAPALLLLLAIVAAVAFAVTRRRASTPSPAPEVAAMAPVTPYGPTVTVGDFEVRREVVVSSPGQVANRRLRVFTVGRNDLPPFDVVFQDMVAIGRSPVSDIMIPNDQQVSARHCVLTPEQGGARIEDTGSRNGTRVNGVPITMPLHIESDSIVGVGRTELRIRILEPGAQ